MSVGKCGIMFVLAIFLIFFLFCVVFMLAIITKRLISLLKNMRASRDTYQRYYYLYNQWINNLHRNEFIYVYLKRHQCQKVIIYGMGEIGKRLYDELEAANAGFECYFIDRNAKYPYREGVALIKPEDISPDLKIDVIIVTPFYAFDAIKADIQSQNIGVPVISIDEIVYSEE
jgi:FlaA1/EpsC-like NDP-sugar epimerase